MFNAMAVLTFVTDSREDFGGFPRIYCTRRRLDGMFDLFGFLPYEHPANRSDNSC